MQSEAIVRTTSSDAISEAAARPFRGRRLSWAEFEALTGRQRPTAANDNREGVVNTPDPVTHGPVAPLSNSANTGIPRACAQAREAGHLQSLQCAQPAPAMGKTFAKAV